MLSGPDINVDPFVATDGYLYIYNLHTRFGDLRVSSTALLATRVAEMVALARIEQVSARQEFRSGLINKGQQTVAGAVDLATNPLGTLSGAATGVGRAFESLQQKPCARRPGRRLSPGATTIRPALAWWLSRPPATGRNVFTWTLPLTGTPNDDAPSVLNASYNFKAEVEIPASGAEGMLITQGGRFAGYGFYVLKNKPVFLWNLVDLKRVRWEGPELTPGKHVLEFDFAYDGMGAGTLAFNNFSGVGRGGTGVLKVDGQAVDTQKMEHTLPFILQWDEALDVGSDTLTGVNDADYQTPFAFTGKIDKVTLTIDRPKLSPEDVKKMEQAQRSTKVSE